MLDTNHIVISNVVKITTTKIDTLSIITIAFIIDSYLNISLKLSYCC